MRAPPEPAVWPADTPDANPGPALFSNIRLLILQVFAIDIATLLTFVVLHQFLIAVTWKPLFGLLYGIVPALVVALAYRAWTATRHTNATRLALGTSLIGGAVWACALALDWGGAANAQTKAQHIYIAVGLIALVAGGITWKLTGDPLTVLLSVGALLVTFGMTAPFLMTRGIGWVNARALVALCVSIVVGGLALEFTSRRFARAGVTA